MKAMLVVTALSTAALVGACREEEQGRPLIHTPGVYQGETDQELSDRQRQSLRERAGMQR